MVMESADDVIIIVNGQYLDTLMEIRQRTLRADEIRNGLCPNSKKTKVLETIIFQIVLLLLITCNFRKYGNFTGRKTTLLIYLAHTLLFISEIFGSVAKLKFFAAN